MTLMESALLGILALAVVVGLLEAVATATDRPGLVDRCWGALLFGVGALYAALGGEATGSHDLAALALLALWATAYGIAASRAAAPRRTGGVARRWVRGVGELFLASAPVLLICTEAYDGAWSWTEAVALALFVAGCGYILWSRRSQTSPVGGFVIAFAALYVLAILTPSGWLTLFSVVVVARRVERTLGLGTTAPYDLEVTGVRQKRSTSAAAARQITRQVHGLAAGTAAAAQLTKGIHRIPD